MRCCHLLNIAFDPSRQEDVVKETHASVSQWNSVPLPLSWTRLDQKVKVGNYNWVTVSSRFCDTSKLCSHLRNFVKTSYPMSNLSQITVLYGENKLQKTIKLPASTTVTDAKKVGSKEILNHLRLQPGVPSSISIDDECTDFYPGTIES